MESKTRGAEDSEAKVRRFQEEIEYMLRQWIDILRKGDPYYNKNLSLTNGITPFVRSGEWRIRRNNMEVSVVIPNYNGIAFLDSVLASLEGQTLKNFEVIFVDNGLLTEAVLSLRAIIRGCISLNCLKIMVSARQLMKGQSFQSTVCPSSEQ